MERLQFGDQLAKVVRESVPCCVGLDPHGASLPKEFADRVVDNPAGGLFQWSKRVLDGLHGIIPVVKPQSALYEQFGFAGVQALEATCKYASDMGFVVLLDAKRGDIGSTAQGYITSAFEQHHADAVTLSPYLGPESLDPWHKYVVKNPGTGAFVLLRTSNPGALPWQGGPVNGTMAQQVADWLNESNAGYYDLGPFGAVVGATIDADEMALWRKTLPRTWFLLPGYGAQGATAQDCQAGFRADGTGALVVSARDVLFPPKGAPVEADWQAGIRERAKTFAADIASIL